MMSKAAVVAGFLAVLAAIDSAEQGRAGVSVDFSHGDLKVSENRRFVVHADGTPFFYLGDTAWELFHRLNRERRSNTWKPAGEGFTVIHAVVPLSWMGSTRRMRTETGRCWTTIPRPNEAYQTCGLHR